MYSFSSTVILKFNFLVCPISEVHGFLLPPYLIYVCKLLYFQGQMTVVILAKYKDDSLIYYLSFLLKTYDIPLHNFATHIS